MKSSHATPETGAVFTLLDIDNTLTDTDGKELNEALLEVLQEFGIRDLCFLTSMHASTLDVDAPAPGTQQVAPLYTRPNLINVLEKRGFRVHKVITPNDVALNNITATSNRPDTRTIGDYYTTWLRAFEMFTSPKKPLTDAQREEVKRTIDAKIQGEYSRLKAEHDKLATIDEKTEFFNRSIPHKGTAYALTLRQLEKVSKDETVTPTSFIAVDDLQNELDNIQRNATPEIPLSTLLVVTRNGATRPDIISSEDDRKTYLNRKEEIKNRYRDAFITHFKKCDPKNLNPLQAKIAARVTDMTHLNMNIEHIESITSDMKLIFIIYVSELKRSTNKDKLTNIRSIIDKIDKKDIAPFRKVIEIETELEKAFRQAENDYYKWRFWAKRPDAFIKELEKTNAKDFHYPRLLATLLKTHYSKCEVLGIPVDQDIKTKVASVGQDTRYTFNSFTIEPPTPKAKPPGATLYQPKKTTESMFPELSEGENLALDQTKKRSEITTCVYDFNQLLKTGFTEEQLKGIEPRITLLISQLDAFKQGKIPPGISLRQDEQSGYRGIIRTLADELNRRMTLAGVKMKAANGWYVDAWEEVEAKLNSDQNKYPFERMLAEKINHFCRLSHMQDRFPNLLQPTIQHTLQ